MATVISNLYVKLTANTAEFQSNMQRVDRRLSQSEKQFKKLTRSVRGLGAAFGVGLSTAVVGRFVRDAVEMGSRLDDVSKKLGVNVEFLQAFGYAARQTGVQTTAAEMGLQRFTRRLAEAQAGTGELRGIIEQYNIAIRNADGSSRSTMEVLRDYADVVKNATTEQEQLRLAFKAFDSEGAGLVTVLRGGAEGLEKWADEAFRMKQAFSQETIDRLAQAENTLERMKVTLTIFSGESFVTVTDGINSITDAATDLNDVLVKLLNPSKWKWIDGFDEKLQKGYQALDDALTPGRSQRGGIETMPPGSSAGAAESGPAATFTAGTDAANEFLNTMPSVSRGLADVQLAAAGLSAEVFEMQNLAGPIREMDFGFSDMAESLTDVKQAASQVNDEIGETASYWQNDIASAVTGFGAALETGLVNAATEGKTAFDDMGRFIMAEIQRIMIRAMILRPLFNSLGNWATGQGWEALGQAFLGSFGGARAAGGPVSSGRSYLVGENGPELFTPGASGMISPSGSFGGGGGNHIFVDARGADAAAVARLERGLRQLDATVDMRAIHAVSNARNRTPGFLKR